ncbi:MAG: dipeptide ABC transporter ATP-binding protein [Pseudomonadota bacterium]|nr:dipeptide ABC transporter ATP-binding protein [Pseudomonadota bacterium]
MTSAAAPLLEARALARHYAVSRGPFRPKGLVRALDGVSFSVSEGETLAIVGESGCGKSTLARQVTMIERPTSGELRLGGDDVAHADRATLQRLRPQVQMVFQNPYASLNPRKQVMTLLEEPLAINSSLSAAARRDAARAMMARVGLRPEHERRYPHMFSGGQRQRIAVARALMLHPRLLVADEPVSALDVSIQAQVLNLLMDLQQDMGIAYLFISHNLQVVRHIAEKVAVLYLGKIVESGPKALVFSRPAHPYTRALLASTPSLRSTSRRRAGHAAVTHAEAARQTSAPGIAALQRTGTALKGEPPSPLHPPSGCAFHGRCPYAIERCRIEAPLLESFDGALVACHRVAEINT